MEALEVGRLGLVARLDERLEARLHEGGEATAQHDLLAEEVGFRLLLEGGLEHACPRAADGSRVRQREVASLAGGVLRHGDQTGHAAAFGVGAAHEVAGTLGGDKCDVDVGLRHNLVEAHREPVAHEQRVARGQVRGDVLVEDRLVLRVRAQEHDQVGFGCGGCHRQHPQARRLRLGHGRRVLPKADAHVDARLLEVERMGMALRAVPDDGDLAPGDEGGIGILVVVHVGHQSSLPS